MSGSFNKFIGLGNLTRDPELRYIPSGAPVCTFDLAFNRTYTTQDGQKKDEVCFMPIVVWGKQAESCGQYLSKGRQALVHPRTGWGRQLPISPFPGGEATRTLRGSVEAPAPTPPGQGQ
jgi:single stranded DNA-binding protein